MRTATRTGRYRLAAMAFGLLAATAGCAQGEVGQQVNVAAAVNGTELVATSPNDPVAITDDEPTELTLSLTNVSDEPVTVRYVRFEGEVIDMIFLTYDTAVSVPLAAGESRTLPPVLLDFFDLGGQADGFLRGNVQLYDADRDPLGSQQVFLDAQGEGLSTLEFFNLLLAGGTVLGAAWNLLRLSQRRLPANRLVRALRFLAIGAGAGLSLAVAFSTLRIWPLGTVQWILFTIVGAIIGYIIGMLLPGSEGDEIDLLDEEDLLEELLLEQQDLLVGATGAGAVGAGVRSTVAADGAGHAGDAGDESGAAGAKSTVAQSGQRGQSGAKPTITGKVAKETIAGAASKATVLSDAASGAGKAAKTTVAGAASKATVVGDAASGAGKAAKATVAGAPLAKETLIDMTEPVEDVTTTTVPKAPGSGARATIAQPDPLDTPTNQAKKQTKETLSDD